MQNVLNAVISALLPARASAATTQEKARIAHFVTRRFDPSSIINSASSRKHNWHPLQIHAEPGATTIPRSLNDSLTCSETGSASSVGAPQ